MKAPFCLSFKSALRAHVRGFMPNCKTSVDVHATCFMAQYALRYARQYALGWRPPLLGRRPMPLGMLQSDAIRVAIYMTICIRLEAIATRSEANAFRYAAK